MSCSCGCLSLVTSSTLMSPDGRAVPGGIIAVMPCWVSHSLRLLCPVVPVRCLHAGGGWGGGNFSVTGLPTAVLGQCPLLTQCVCSADLVEIFKCL